jgi:hypothetical protein
MKNIKIIVLFAIVCLTALTASVYAYPTVGDGTDSGNCYACHSTRYTEDSEWHTDHQDNAGGDCTTCHATAEGGGTVSTSVCSNCHANLPDEWVKNHNDIGIDTCIACHTVDAGSGEAGCPAETVLGAESPQLDTLRKFRDEVLLKKTGGETLIKTYYIMAAPIVSLCEKNPAIKASVKNMIETVIPVIEKLLVDDNE